MTNGFESQGKTKAIGGSEAAFGIPSLDTIPRDWTIMEANAVSLKVSKGTTPPKTEVSVHGDIPFLRVNNLSFFGSLQKDSDFIYVSKGAHEKFLARSKAYPGDVLMNIVGPPLGKTALLDESWPEYNMNQAVVFYRLDKKHVVPEYFLAFLSSYNAQNWLQARSKKTSGQQNLTIELCKQLPLPLPPLPEQKKIAQILSTWDQAITATERLLENSQQRKKGLMQQLLTGKKRLPGFEGEWRQVKLASVAEMSSGGTPKSSVAEYYNGDIPWVSIADMTSQGKWIDCTEKSLSKLGIEHSTARLYPVNTVLYAMYASIGECSIARVLVSSSQAILGIRPGDDLHYEFLYFYLSSLKEEIKLQGQQGTQSNLNAGMVKGFKIPLPSMQEQIGISEVLNSADNEISALEKSVFSLKREKKALMQQLLTGKRRVNVEAEAA